MPAEITEHEYTHHVEADWRRAKQNLAKEKSIAIATCLDHMKDVEELLEAEGDGYETVVEHTRNLSARLRSIKADYDSQTQIR